MDFTNLTVDRPPEIHANWSLHDYLGAARVRMSLGRSRYRVKPGLYRLGRPGKKSDVFVSANYKLSFDILRKNLAGLDAWILVLDSRGINVWCAAGKGTFGSDELIRQVTKCELNRYVDHKRLIVPQLGASGIAAHKVKEATGFSVKFGPVRAADIKSYIADGYKKTVAERTVEFKFKDRLLLIPVELVNSWSYLLGAILLVMFLSGIHPDGFSFQLVRTEGIRAALFLLAAYLSGTFLAPLLLPLLPFRQFGGKGLIAGLLVFGIMMLLIPADLSPLCIAAWFLLSGAVSSFLTMNFTGASTYTSLSGVRKEMRIFVPVQILLASSGMILLIISKLH